MPIHFFAALHLQHTLACISFILFFGISLYVDLALDSFLVSDDGFKDEIQENVASNKKEKLRLRIC